MPPARHPPPRWPSRASGRPPPAGAGDSPRTALLTTAALPRSHSASLIRHTFRRTGASRCDKEIRMSQQHISPYINFRGRAREAMEFYQRVLGGDLHLHTLDEQGQPKPAGPGDRITHAVLEADGARIVGSDGHPQY